MKAATRLAVAALVALSSLCVVVSATSNDNVKVIVDQDNSMPFFIGSEKLVGVTTAVSTAATDNAAISSLLDTALSSKHDNATIKAWRRIVSGNASLVASAGPALSGELKCFVGDIGQVTGLQYGSAVVCQKSDRVVNVKIGTNYVSNIKVVLGKNAMIAGLQFVLTDGISGTSTVTYCGTKNGLSAYIGRAGMSVGVLGGTCSAGAVGRRRLSQNSTSALTPPGLVGSTFTSILTPAPQGSNTAPSFSPETKFTIGGKSFSGDAVTASSV